MGTATGLKYALTGRVHGISGIGARVEHTTWRMASIGGLCVGGQGCVFAATCSFHCAAGVPGAPQSLHGLRVASCRPAWQQP